MESKADLRTLMRQRLEALSAATEAWTAASRTACSALAAWSEWRRASLVLGYLAMPSELSCDPLLSQALNTGRTVAVPRVEGADLAFRRIRSLEGPWSSGPFGLREPHSNTPIIDCGKLPGPLLVIVPGLAFDRRGGRLGRGKGYYDSFLRLLRAQRPDLLCVGFAAQAQILDAVPMDARDERMDALCTDAGFEYVLP